jgi:hypothetical protein
MLATASEKGTLVRVYDTPRGTLLHEFRRGADRAQVRVAPRTLPPSRHSMRVCM